MKDMITIIYILAGILVFFSVIWRIRFLSDKYEETMDLLNEMDNYYQKISILSNARDAAKTEIAELMAQYNIEHIPEDSSNERPTNLSNSIKINPHNFIDSNQSEINKIIQSKKEKMELYENELDHISCYYNLFAMRLKDIKHRFPLVAFMISAEIQNIKPL